MAWSARRVPLSNEHIVIHALSHLYSYNASNKNSADAVDCRRQIYDHQVLRSL